MEKGQIFSIDFIVSMIIAVLAIGMLLNFYELTLYESKEAKLQNELQIIALNASNIILNDNKCNPSPQGSIKFRDQGYKLFGCTNNNFPSLNKQKLMIPDGFACYVTNTGPVTVSFSQCDVDVLETVNNVAVVERNFLSISGSAPVTKNDYEDCINSGCSYYTTNELIVKVWRE